MGIRDNGIIDEATTLKFQFLKNGVAFDVYDFQKVRIFASNDDAKNEVNIIEEIVPPNINHINTGLYEYVVNPISQVGTYFDKVYLIPENGMPVWNSSLAINPFYLKKDICGGASSGSIEKVRVYFNIFDLEVNADKEDNVYVKLNKDWAWYNKELIKNNFISPIEIDDNGNVTFDVVETDTLDLSNDIQTGDRYYYILEIGNFKRCFTIPKGIVDSYLKDLPTYTVCN